MAKQCRNRGLLWRDSNVDHASLNKIHISAALNKHHDFFSAHTFGKHGGHNIRFVIVRDGDKKINLIDMLFREQFLIRRIAIKNDRMLKFLGKFRGALLIAFDKLNAVVFFQPLREPCADITAADQHDAFIRLFKALKFAHYGADMLRCGDKKDFIACFHNGRSLRPDRPIVAKNSGYAGVDMRHMFAHR